MMPTLIDAIKQMFPSETDESIQSDLSEVRQQHPEWDDATIFKNLMAFNQKKQVEMPTEQDAARYQQVRDYVAKSRGVTPDAGRQVIPMLAKGVAGAADAALLARDVKGGYMENLMKAEETQAKGLEDATEKELGRISGREKVLQLVQARGLAGAQKAGTKAEEEAPDTPAANAARAILAKLDPEGHAGGRYDKMGKTDLNKAVSNLTGVGKLETTQAGQEQTQEQRREERIIKLREDIKQSKAYQSWLDIKNSATNLADAAANPSSKRTLGAIYSYVRALDPGSVVREGEIKLAGEARSKAQQLEGYFRRIMGGQVLTPGEIQELADWAKGKEKYAKRTAINANKSIVNQAKRENYPMEEISTDLFAPGWDQPEQTSGGGLGDVPVDQAPKDPAKRAEWRKARLEALRAQQGE
jgi:hypothetical protein